MELNQSAIGFVCSAPGADFEPDPDDAGGIYAVDVEGGELAHREKTPCESPIYATFHPSGEYMYVTHGLSDGAISSYRLDETGGLEKLNEQASGGAIPLYLSIDATASYLFVANYEGRTFSMLPIEDDGRLGPAAQTIEHEGSSVNPDRQQKPYPHSVEPGPNNRFVYVADLGLDRIMVYRFDSDAGSLAFEEELSVAVPEGSGPRHLEFHPNERFLYVINELDGTLTSFEYDSETGEISLLETVPTMPEGFEGTEWGGDIHVHPSGQWLFATNREHSSLARYEIDTETGHLRPLENEMDVECPRHVTTDADGEYLFVANQGGDSVVSFDIDPDSGDLTATDHRVSVPEPVCVELLESEH